MPQSLEDILLIVWRQTLIEHSNTVNVDGHTYPVQITKGRRLEQVDFSFGERNLRGLEQNPAGQSWPVKHPGYTHPTPRFFRGNLPQRNFKMEHAGAQHH